MLLEFRLPLINPHMSTALLECAYGDAGAHLKAGSKLLDLSIDLSDSFSQDCPPISFYRIVVRENAFVRAFRASAGQACNAGELIAVFTTAADDPVDGPAQRGIRFATAGIVRHPGMWSESAR